MLSPASLTHRELHAEALPSLSRHFRVPGAKFLHQHLSSASLCRSATHRQHYDSRWWPRWAKRMRQALWQSRASSSAAQLCLLRTPPPPPLRRPLESRPAPSLPHRAVLKSTSTHLSILNGKVSLSFVSKLN